MDKVDQLTQQNAVVLAGQVSVLRIEAATTGRLAMAARWRRDQ